VGSDYPFAIRQPLPAAFARQTLAHADFTANAKALFDGQAAAARPRASARHA
jgi:hypothetical protein